MDIKLKDVYKNNESIFSELEIVFPPIKYIETLTSIKNYFYSYDRILWGPYYPYTFSPNLFKNTNFEKYSITLLRKKCWLVNQPDYYLIHITPRRLQMGLSLNTVQTKLGGIGALTTIQDCIDVIVQMIKKYNIV